MTSPRLVLREPRLEECEELSALCLRSKAHWGYDRDFLDKCREELRVTPQTIAVNFSRVIEIEGVLSGFVEVAIEGSRAVLEKLFVDPSAMGKGIGQAAMDAAIEYALSRGAGALVIDADPEAAPFYRRFGSVEIGRVPSLSIPGRNLPRLRLDIPRRN